MDCSRTFYAASGLAHIPIIVIAIFVVENMNNKNKLKAELIGELNEPAPPKVRSFKKTVTRFSFLSELWSFSIEHQLNQNKVS